ncbi:hypothetical protein ACHAXN_010434 [Cyclotella atomus]
MISNIKILISILASITPIAAAAARQHDILSLADVQRLLRTDLDNELDKIAHDDTASLQTVLQLSATGKLHSRQHFNVRRRSLDWNENSAGNSERNAAAASSTEITVDIIWNNLVQHAWKIAKSMHRTSIGSLVQTADSEDEAISCPFLICAMDEIGQNSHRTDNYKQLIAAFNKEYEESLLVKSAHNETCGIVTLNPSDAQRGIASYEGQQHVIAMPLVDIMKIQSGTLDEVSSIGWSVPYANNTSAVSSSSSKNVTERLGLWERIIVVDFAPGVGGMREESQLLDVVNSIVSDIQDIGEVGWLHRLNEQERQSYQVDKSVASVPTLSEMFSLTATMNEIEGHQSNNTRIAFWNQAFERGIESEHSCSEMFSTLFVKPRSGYFGFDMILNPTDGPPPSDYYSSASNPACVASLIAGLSIHQQVSAIPMETIRMCFIKD